jgi:hypothetical protein
MQEQINTPDPTSPCISTRKTTKRGQAVEAYKALYSKIMAYSNVDGMIYKDIAEELNRQGIRTINGLQWSTNRIACFVSNYRVAVERKDTTKRRQALAAKQKAERKALKEKVRAERKALATASRELSKKPIATVPARATIQAMIDAETERRVKEGLDLALKKQLIGQTPPTYKDKPTTHPTVIGDTKDLVAAKRELAVLHYCLKHKLDFNATTELIELLRTH